MFTVYEGSQYKIKAIITTISNSNTLTAGSSYFINCNSSAGSLTMINSKNGVLFFKDNYLKYVNITISDSYVISFGSITTISTNNINYISSDLLDSSHIILCYSDYTDSKGYACVVSVSVDYTISFGSLYSYYTNTLHNSVKVGVSNKFAIIFKAADTSKGCNYWKYI